MWFVILLGKLDFVADRLFGIVDLAWRLFVFVLFLDWLLWLLVSLLVLLCVVWFCFVFCLLLYFGCGLNSDCLGFMILSFLGC